MRTLRPVIAADPRLFGRGEPRTAEPAYERRSTFADDLWLFGVTFAGGFIFVSILLG